MGLGLESGWLMYLGNLDIYIYTYYIYISQ